MGKFSKYLKGQRVIANGNKYLAGTITSTNYLVLHKVMVRWDKQEGREQLPPCLMPLDALLPYKSKFKFWFHKKFAFIIK